MSLLKPVPPSQFVFGDNLLQGAVEALGLLFALPILLPAGTQQHAGADRRGWRARLLPSGSVVPLLLAYTLLCYVVGQ